MNIKQKLFTAIALSFLIGLILPTVTAYLVYKNEPPKFTSQIKIDIQVDSTSYSWDVLNSTLDTVRLTVNGKLYILRSGSGFGRGIIK